jgi:hypothetical protein
MSVTENLKQDDADDNGKYDRQQEEASPGHSHHSGVSIESGVDQEVDPGRSFSKLS